MVEDAMESIHNETCFHMLKMTVSAAGVRMLLFPLAQKPAFQMMLLLD